MNEHLTPEQAVIAGATGIARSEQKSIDVDLVNLTPDQWVAIGHEVGALDLVSVMRAIRVAYRMGFDEGRNA